MNALEYLQIKYGSNRPPAMTAVEAKAFGEKWPLKKGWQDRCAGVELTQSIRDKLTARLEKKAKKKPRKGKPVSAYHQKGADVLRAKSGPVTVIRHPEGRPSPARKAEPPRAPSNYRGPYIDPNSPEFLTSYQWRSVRMDALVKYGAVCMCCGATPAHGAVMNVDHIKPRRTHPDLALNIDNLQILCGVCNHGKGNRHDTDWRAALQPEPEHLSEFSARYVNDLLRQF